jgi:hypothetical protein
LGITQDDFLRLTMRDLEYKINGKLFDVYAGSRLVAAAFAGGKPSEIVELWLDEYNEEFRAELVAELKQADWVKRILSDGRTEQV